MKYFGASEEEPEVEEDDMANPFAALKDMFK